MGSLSIENTEGDQVLPGDDANDYAEKLWDYIDAIEKINTELTGALRQCIKLLEQFTGSVPDPAGWEELLDNFRNLLDAAVGANRENSVH
jgi:hypothetical protein